MSRATLTADSTAQALPLTERPAWKALEAHCATIRNLHLRQLFAEDPRRGARLSTEAAGIYLDYSKNRITDETIRLLVRLAGECGLRERIDAMFRGERINVTEKRAVPHTALRAPETERYSMDSAIGLSTIRSINGASRWAKCWRSGRSLSLKARANRSSSMTARPTRSSGATADSVKDVHECKSTGR